MTAQQLYDRNLSVPSDIGAHLPRLLRLGEYCKRITEFGVRGGNSTSAWLEASPYVLRCYDLAKPAELALYEKIAAEDDTDFQFIQADTSKLDDIEETDLLFLDTLHTAQQIEAELKHHRRVSKYIVFHDTEMNGWKGENGQPGLKVTLIEFLLDHPEWRIEANYRDCNGLTVLRREE